MFILRIPFELASGQKLQTTDDFAQFGALSFKLKKEQDLYILVIRGFESEEQARAYLERAWSGMMWFLLQQGIAPRWNMEAKSIFLSEDPVEAAKNIAASFGGGELKPVDGLIEGHSPAIFDDEGHYLVNTTGRATITMGNAAEQFFERFREGVKFANWRRCLADGKLRIAFELYGAFFSESTPNAKFLTLVMVLEALAVPEDKPTSELAALEVAAMAIRTKAEECSPASSERTLLKKLSNDLAARNKTSITDQIRKLVADTLLTHGDEDAKEIASRAVHIYRRRGKLGY